jgi:hypothetical protein
LTRKKESQVLSRVAYLTSSQLADKILATDLAVFLDGRGYANRRVSAMGKAAESQPNPPDHSMGVGRQG